MGVKICATLLLCCGLTAFSQTGITIGGSLPANNALETRVVDLNGDGQLDLLSFDFNGLSVRLNQGAGLFSSAIAYPLDLGAGSSPSRAYAVADFNQDGNADVVAVTNLGIFFSAGDGKGGFVPIRPTGIQTETRTQNVVTGDFNRDGFLDIAVGGFGTGVRLFLGNGTGDFQERARPTSTLPGGPTDISLQAADVNGDDIPDLLGVDPLNLALYVFINDGHGTFRLSQLLRPEGLARSEAFYAADFDRDGKLDLAIIVNQAFFESASLSQQRTLEIWNQTSSGIFAKGRTVAILPDQVRIAAADLNGDKNPDLVLAGPTSTTFYLGDGTGSFIKGESIAVTGSIAVGDLNQTGRAKVVLTTGKTISIVGFDAPPSRVMLYRNLNPFTFGETEIFTATVDAEPVLSGFPTGTVRLVDNGQIVQTALLFNGAAHFAIPFSPGSHRFRAEYDGDRQYGAGFAELTVLETGAPATITAFTSPVSARVLDVKGNPVSGIGVVFTAPADGPSGNFAGSASALVITNADGLAGAPTFSPNNTKGIYSIAVTLSGYPGIGTSISLVN